MDHHQTMASVLLIFLVSAHQVFAATLHPAASPHNAPTTTDLISKTCAAVPFKDLCIKTLSADPDSVEADLAGLASIAIKVAMQNGTDTYNYVDQLQKKAQYQPFTQQCLSDCSEHYMDAVDQLEDSLAAIDAQGFNDVATWVQAAMTDAESCEDGFKDGSGPSLLTDRYAVFNQLCSNALSIANMLAKA
ncbi:putative invertase inhibitor [Papaver somniferum]|uniref:putative invertase inhibitor n=1 Tax=Papaver somniferum TaxID=3469 RepID=UPI000E6FFBBD|nr:putative invertase inhibitor [Papaver somniferum]